MRKSLPLLLVGLLFIAACSKKNAPNPTPNPIVVIPQPLPAGTVTTLAGSGSPGFVNGSKTAASFTAPAGVAVVSNDYVYVADAENNLIRQINPNGLVSTLAGAGGADTLVNGTGTAAAFGYPSGVAVDAAGNVYVADLLNNVIRKVTMDGVATTFAGSGKSGAANGTGASASFYAPSGVAIDGSGNIYVADQGNSMVRVITPGGVVSTLAGSGAVGTANGTGAAASFNIPNSVAVDASGNVYVADLKNDLIRKITPAGVVSTFAGNLTGSANGTGTSASFNGPSGVAVDANGNVYVADSNNNLIRMITPAGVVTTLAGSGAQGFTNAVGTAASFNYPTGVAVDAKGNVYVADNGNNAIRVISSGK